MEGLKGKSRNIAEQDLIKELDFSELFQSEDNDQNHTSEELEDEELEHISEKYGISSSNITEDEKKGWLRKHVHLCDPKCEYIKSRDDVQVGYKCLCCGLFHALYLNTGLLHMHSEFHSVDIPFKCGQGCGVNCNSGAIDKTVFKFNQHFYQGVHQPVNLPSFCQLTYPILEESSEGADQPSVSSCQSASGFFADTDHLRNLDSREILDVEAPNTVKEHSSTEPEALKLIDQVSEGPPSTSPFQSASVVSDDPDHLGHLDSSEMLLNTEAQNAMKHVSSTEPEQLNVNQSEIDNQNQKIDSSNKKIVPLTESQPGVSSSTTISQHFSPRQLGHICSPTSESFRSCPSVIFGCECTICGPGNVVFLDENILNVHMTAHGKEEDPFLCSSGCENYKAGVTPRTVDTFYEHFHQGEHEKLQYQMAGLSFSRNEPRPSNRPRPSKKASKQKSGGTSRFEVQGVAIEHGDGVTPTIITGESDVELAKEALSEDG